LAGAIAPAAAGLHARHLAGKTAPEVISFGHAPARPAVSIVVPLYKVLDFLRFQLAAFATDPAMAEVDLIYVLDSPEQRTELEHLLHGLHALYGLPLRLAVLSGNYGFAAASNAGAGLATAPAVLFLNSDVIPDRPGWLRTLQAALEGEGGLAAVGPKLLFDDDSLQHAGMYFARDLSAKWYNAHYFKGLPRNFAAAATARSVPAVTGACLLTQRALIERLGGFSEDYIIGDYEDSDLCLRLREAGHEIGYVPGAELYHLERQSIQHHVAYTGGAACAYNRRLHSERWGWLMEELCGEPSRRSSGKTRRKVAA
jgi:GT2 family glycosyltransferase